MRPTRPWFLAAGLVLTGAALLPARAADQPMRRSGLWEINAKAMGMANVIQSCIDASKDKPDAMIGGSGRQICDTAQMSPVASGFQFHVVCHPSAKMTMVAEGTVTGDMQSAYTVNSTMTMDPAPPGMPTMTTTITARYLGACPADLQPSDSKINGRVVHAPAS